VALVVVSWRLWVPQHRFPQVPLFDFLCQTPLFVDGVLLGLLGVGLGGTLRWGERGRWRTGALLCVLLGLGGLVALDQHRLQAWAYQAMIIALLLLTTPPRLGVPLLRGLAVSVYVYSAAGKLDYQFLHTVGQQFLGAVGDGLGIAIETWQPATRIRAALAFPLAELGLGLAAWFPGTRRLAGWGLVALHATLLWLLGPWGLGHQPGVLLWNVFFIGQALLLFVGVGAGPAETPTRIPVGWWVSGLPLLWAAVLVLPLTERWGVWDHWPSWALYSPHSSRLVFAIHASQVEQVPVSLRPFFEAKQEGGGWQGLEIDRWSLETLGVPVYPQGRFQLGVASAVVGQAELGSAIRFELLGPADRWTGRRGVEAAGGANELERAADRFWLNTTPRGSWRPGVASVEGSS
jgi:hypothetical protein